MNCIICAELFPGFNSNINLPGREESGSAPTSPSLQLQDKNANNHSTHSPSPAAIENGNQISNGNISVANLNPIIFHKGGSLPCSCGVMQKTHTGVKVCV